MKLRGLTIAALTFAASYSSAAGAQDQVWLQDRRYTEGAGLRAGNLEIHPGVAGEVGYDSNYFLRAPSENPVDALRLRVTPSLSLSTISQLRREAEGGGGELPKVTFRAGAAATYNEFIATKSENSDALSGQRNISGMGNLQLAILPGRPLGGDVFGDFIRTAQPSNNPDANYNRITARVGAGLVWAPGGGMFDWRLGYEYGLTYFEQAEFRGLSDFYNQVNTRGRWRFLPRTAFLYDGSVSFRRYNSAQRTTSQLDSDPVRARIGLNGLVSPSFALLAMVGWGSSFYKGLNAQQFDSVIGQAELKWYITPNPGLDPAAATLALSSVAVGYNRDFFNSYLGDFFQRDRGYLNLTHFFGGRFLLVADAGLARIGYPGIFGNSRMTRVSSAFSTLRLETSLFGEYRVTDSLGLNATLRYSADITDVRIGTPVTGGVVDDLQWKRFEAYAGVRWFL
jgi:hypothetical protein